MYRNLRKRALLPILGAAVVCMLVAAQSASANIVRPAGATPIGASTVIAYAPCDAPGAGQHNPANLPGAACAPAQYTPRLTAGDPVVNGSGRELPREHQAGRDAGSDQRPVPVRRSEQQLPAVTCGARPATPPEPAAARL